MSLKQKKMKMKINNFIIIFLSIILLASCKSREVNKTFHKENEKVEIKEKSKVDSSSLEISKKTSDLKIFEENFNFTITPNSPGEIVKFNFKVGEKEYQGEANGSINFSDDKKETIVRDTIYTEKIKEVVKEVHLDKKEEKEITDKEKQQKVEYLEAQWYAIFILSVISIFKLAMYIINKLKNDTYGKL